YGQMPGDRPGAVRDRSPAGARHGRGGPAVEDPAAPHLERDQRAEMQAEPAAPPVLGDELLDVAGVEDPPPPALAAEQQFAQVGAELAAEPRVERHREAHLRPVQDLARQQRRQSATEQLLARAVPEL